MFKIIDRYILREIVLPFTIGLIVFTFVLEIPIILRQGEDLVAKGVEWPTIVHLLILLLPAQLSLTIPMSLLLGILIGFGRLSADREFVALQACGVSLARLLRPLLLVSLVATAAAAHQIIVALPNSNQTYREITLGVVASRVERAVRPGEFFEDFPHMVIRVRDLPPTGGWEGVFLADTSQAGRTTVYFARRGHIRLDREQRLVLLQLIDGTAHTTYTDKPEESDNQRFETYVATLDPNTVFPPPPAKGATEMTFGELDAQIKNALEHGDPGYVYRFMYQQKFALPATCPILALIGLALGASNRKDGKLASFVLGFVVIFLYYIGLYLFRALALGGRFPPEWAPWMPNVLMLGAGVFLMVRRERSADRPIRISMPAFRRAAASEASTTAVKPPRRRTVVVVRVPRLNLPMPRTLDFYVAGQYWRIVWVGVLSLLGIFYISTFIDVADELARSEVTLKTILLYFYYQTPQFVFFVLPIAVLVATLVTVAVMSKNSELIVMRACGISLYRTMAPFVLFGVLVSGLLFYAQERILPGANREADRYNRLVRGFGPATSPFNQRWVIGRSGVLYRYNLFDSTKNHFLSLWMYEVSREEWRLGALTYSANATLEREDPGKPDYAVWRGTKGWERHFTAGTGKNAGSLAVKYEPFAERELSIETPEYFASRFVETEQMSYDQMLSFNELRDYIDQTRASGANVMGLVVALHRKIAFPLVTVVMTLIAVPFAAGGGRKGALYGIGVGIVLALAYFVTMSVFGALGTGGVLPPILAAWAPILLFGAAALYLVLTVRT